MRPQPSGHRRALNVLVFIDSLAMTATTKMILFVIVALVLVFVVLIVLGLATSYELEG